LFLIFSMTGVLPGLVLLCVLLRVLAPRRRRLQRVLVAITLGCWVGFFLADYCDWIDLVRRAQSNNPAAYRLLNWLGFSGGGHDLIYFWNGLVITFWFTLPLSLLAYWSGPRAQACAS
jgi:hypothetical protein